MRFNLFLFLILSSVHSYGQHIPMDSLFQLAARQTPLLMKELTLVNRQDSSLVAPRSLTETGSLIAVKRSDWTSGFFSGILWHLYAYTHEEKWKKLAQQYTQAIVPEQYNGKSHDMGFKLYNSVGRGHQLTGDSTYRQILIQGAKTLSTRFNPMVGAIRSWDHSADKWAFPVIIDNMLNLELLFEATKLTGDSSFYRIAVLHANTTMKNHFRSDYSTYHVVGYDPKTGAVEKRNTHQGYQDNSTWARGEAWALYGYTMCFRETADTAYLSQAEHVAQWLSAHLPLDSVPYWDFDAPNIPHEPKDASAAAVMASALYELSGYSKKGSFYLEWADRLMHQLVKSYLSKEGDSRGFLLLHSTGFKPAGSEIDQPLIYADYYFLEALLRRQSILRTHNPAAYVNPFIGASTSAEAAGVYHGLGKTFPGAATPFGLVQLSPNTITGGDNGSGYSYEQPYIEGFAFTQMSGIGWYGDLGNFLVTPTNGPLHVIAGRHPELGAGYRSHYDKESENASAGYYAATLTDYGIHVETTAAPHSGMLRFTFPENKQSRIQIDLARRVGGTAVAQYIKVVDEHTIAGWMKCTPDGGGWGNGDGKPNYTVYFYAQFDKPLKRYGVWNAAIPDKQGRKLQDIEGAAYDALIQQAQLMPQIKEKEGKHLGFYTEFETKANETVLMKAGISFVSMQGAQQNLKAEIPHWEFDQVRQQAEDLWNAALSKVKITGGTEEQKTVFYTALYHTMIDPRAMADVDGTYPGGDGQVHQNNHFTKRTIFSGWDVFRSQFPLQTIINPKVVSDMVNSLVELADENDSTYLERWEFLNAYSGCMLGNPAVSVLVDAYNKGIRDFDVQKAYRYARNTIDQFGNGERGHSGDISHTLENAYSEWCLAQLADSLQDKAVAALYNNRAQSYQHIFDTEKGWFRNKKADGAWEKWPDGGRIAQPTVESNSYQQGWFVPHDVDGLAKLLGGKDKMIADLVSFFEHTPKDFKWNDYYNHANEPVHQVPFLFNRLGVPWLTQKWSRIICENAYHNKVEGLVGNEDVGQMSAWYVLASAGIHMVCPGDNRYEITAPLFDKTSMTVGYEEGKTKTFDIIAHHNGPGATYIQSAKLNGKPYPKCWISYQDILTGGQLELEMGSEPNKNWGIY